MIDFKYKDDIRSVFLSLTFLQRRGFFIDFPTVLKWIGAFDDKPTDYQQQKVVEHCIDRYLRNEKYMFLEDVEYKITTDPENPKRNLILMSDRGFKKLCIIARYPRSVNVRQYYLKLEKEYVQALMAEPVVNLKKLDTIRRNAEDLKKYKKDSIFWSSKAQLAIAAAAFQRNKLRSLEDELTSVDLNNDLAASKLAKDQNDLKKLKKNIMEDPDKNMRVELETLQRKFLKTIYAKVIDPIKINTLAKPKADCRKKADSGPNPPKLKYRMEKYLSREKVIEMGLQTESEDERDNQESNTGELWEGRITFDASLKPLDSAIVYYTIEDSKPAKGVIAKKLYIPKIKAKSEQTNHLDELKLFLGAKREYRTPTPDVYKVDFNTMNKFLRRLYIDKNTNDAFKRYVESEYNHTMYSY